MFGLSDQGPDHSGKKIPSWHAIRACIKGTVLGHRWVAGQIGGKAPPVDTDQVARIQAMVGDGEQMGGLDMRQLT
jgi:hypothetical protein